MASIQTRASVLAIKPETTEGTPVLPSSATDYIALQDDFAMEPARDVLENAELKSSIGAAKPILGAENPTASLSHYLRASGTVAQAPAYGELLEAAFGSVVVAAVERDTVASSTTTVVKVDAGEGAGFQRGQALLVKGAVSGSGNYSIRCIDSVATDDLTLGFRLASAPGTGVNLGRAVLYKPANTGHQTVTVWHYLGNSGAVQMMSGGRVTSYSVEATAGDLIGQSFDIEGLSYYWNPINITSTDTKLDFTDDDGTFAATVSAKVYKDPTELANAIQTAMNDTASTQTYTVTYSSTTGKYTIKGTGTLLSLLWNTGTNAANTIGDKIGFLTAADDTGIAATTGYTSDNGITLVAPHTPSYDSADPLAAKNMEVLFGDTTDYVCFNASTISFSMATPKTDIESICAESGKAGSVIQSRAVTISVTALLEQYEADKFYRYNNGSNVKFQFSFGEKSGGNWVPGKCGALYVPTATITSYSVEDQDGLVALSCELTAYVNSSGEGEFFLNFL